MQPSNFRSILLLSFSILVAAICAATAFGQLAPAPGGEFYNYFPGQQYVDVVSYDNYSQLSDRFYHEILTIANGKPIALGELGSPPSAEILKSQPKWVWFMTWAGMEGGLQAGRIKEAYGNPYFINRGDPLPISNK